MIKKFQQTLTISEAYVNERLDHVLAKLIPDYSRTQIKEWIDSGHVLLDGKSAKPKTKLRGGEIVSVDITIKSELKWQPQALPLTIVYEDDALLVINKPAGLVVHPGAGNRDHTLLNALLHHEPALKLLPRAGILHRLDKDTSGLLIIAKTTASLKHLSQQLKKRSLVRKYQAIVYGKLISGGIIEAPISRHPLQRKRMAIIDTGKHAVTHYRVTEKFRAHTRLTIKLETGRTHQIRVHLAHLHHSIVGDPIYGGRVKLSKNMSPSLISKLRQFKRQALHAFELEFVHPSNQQIMHFKIDLPEDMEILLSLLRKDKEENGIY